jgi:hypothetical protein
MDYTGSCDEEQRDIDESDGIELEECFHQNPYGVPLANHDVMNVESVVIQSLDENSKVIHEAKLGYIGDGDTIRYISPPAKSLQLKATGRNIDEKEIIHVLKFGFTNNPSLYPVLKRNQHGGWFKFVSFVLFGRDCFILMINIEPRYSHLGLFSTATLSPSRRA